MDPGIMSLEKWTSDPGPGAGRSAELVHRASVFLVRVLNYIRRNLSTAALFPIDAVTIPFTLYRERKTGRRPYILVSNAYYHNSAGVAACHRLVHELNESGYDAYCTQPVNPEWNERRIGVLGRFLLMRFGQPIVVYPEVVNGNPLRAAHVVRWMLNVPGAIKGGKGAIAVDSSELVFAWSKKFYPTDRILCWDNVEYDLFNNVSLPPKDVDCFYVGKGPKRGANPTPFTEAMVEITRMWPPTRAELADLLRRTRILYTYDDLTMLTYEALLCDCRVILLPEHRELFIDDPFWDFVKQDHKAQLDRFIAETQQLNRGTPQLTRD